MAYSSFTLDKVIETFELDIVDSEELFADIETSGTAGAFYHGSGEKGVVGNGYQH